MVQWYCTWSHPPVFQDAVHNRDDVSSICSCYFMYGWLHIISRAPKISWNLRPVTYQKRIIRMRPFTDVANKQDMPGKIRCRGLGTFHTGTYRLCVHIILYSRQVMDAQVNRICSQPTSNYSRLHFGNASFRGTIGIVLHRMRVSTPYIRLAYVRPHSLRSTDQYLSYS